MSSNPATGAGEKAGKDKPKKDRGKGVAQDHSFLASAPTSELPPEIGARTVSVCDVHDPVCDYDPDTTQLSPAILAIHTSYAPTTTGAHAWGAPLYQLVMNAGSASSASSATALGLGAAGS